MRVPDAGFCVKLCLTVSDPSHGGVSMPNQMFEVASPFEEIDLVDGEGLADDALDAQSLEINARRALVENAESLRLARSL